MGAMSFVNGGGSAAVPVEIEEREFYESRKGVSASDSCPAAPGGCGARASLEIPVERGGAPNGVAIRALQLRRGFRGRLCAAPGRRVGAVAPAERAIERVHADLVELVHGAHPPRMHPIGVVMRR